jgi:ABC-type transport system involved in cytochrome c biogenesis permease subunit
VYSYVTVKLIGYIFFTGHIFFLGYAVLKSGYIPKGFGILLLIAFLCYIVLLYGKSYVPEALLPIFVVPAAIAELALGIWLLVKRATMPELRAQ